MRGLEYAVKIRITPADAGKTRTFRFAPAAIQDHPRGCGENVQQSIDRQWLSGSPPRMRGKQECPFPNYAPRRITPADAGKTQEAVEVLDIYRDHPRGCGENLCCTMPTARSSGSPPRMRGKRIARQQCCFLRRITPADAGKTPHKCRPMVFIRDHPRGCGENQVYRHSGGKLVGSPPRMRGKQGGNMHTIQVSGITPADAGKTPEGTCMSQLYADHPRGCGENTESDCKVQIH